MTSNTNGGTLTVVGTTTSPASSVTVNSTTAALYGDSTFAASGLALTTSYTATGSDSYGRHSTNSVTVSIATNVTFQYDGNGNLTNDGLRNFAYDDENQLIQVFVSNAWMSQFQYDGKMRRRIRKEFTWASGAWAETNEIHYVYDGNQVIQERDTNNNPVTTFTRGKDLSGSFEGAGGIGGLLSRSDAAAANTATANCFYHSDANGNVTMLIDASNAPVAKYLYDAFGNTLSKSGIMADVNNYRFSGKEWHQNSGLAYYLYRYYDPHLQRWVNRDPIVESGTALLNHEGERSSSGETDKEDLFSYVRNNGVNLFDAFGLIDVDVYIWHATGLGGLHECGGVGHVMIANHGTTVPILSPFPVPHGMYGDNTPYNWAQTFREERRPADYAYHIHLPNDNAFSTTATDHKFRKKWVFYPINENQTQCAVAASAALKAGGLPIVDHVLWPEALNGQIQPLAYQNTWTGATVVPLYSPVQ